MKINAADICRELELFAGRVATAVDVIRQILQVVFTRD